MECDLLCVNRVTSDIRFLCNLRKSIFELRKSKFTHLCKPCERKIYAILYLHNLRKFA